MADAYSFDELLGFLDHAAEKGLMPAATATALGVATRNVVEVLDGGERDDVRRLDADAIIRRFQNKRARDFSGDTLKEYGRRFRRAIDLFTAWRDDPANFRVKTRATAAQRPRRNGGPTANATSDRPARSIRDAEPPPAARTPPAGHAEGPARPEPAPDAYQTTFALGRDRLVTLVNVPVDLTSTEAERLATFVRALGASPGG